MTSMSNGISFGYTLSSEENAPQALVALARRAEDAGFEFLGISDHYHPWVEAQGHSPFVWSVLGAIAQATERVQVGIGVTCPIMRIHPAIVAHAAATTSLLFGDRFFFGVGTGEALNEHILGDPWPPAEIRFEMLAEAVDIMRELWKGEAVTRRGIHYRVDNARIFTRPDTPIPVPVSAFGPQATEMAAQIGDGFMTTSPDAENLEKYRELGGKGPAQAGVKVCWGRDEAQCRKQAHELWRSSSIPGQLSQDLPMPSHFEQASELVTEDMVAEKMPCGPDPERHAEVIRKYADAGFDELFVSQVGDVTEEFFEFLRKEVEPRL